MQTTENQSILHKSYEGLTYSELSEEYNLPDYLPDITRLLKVESKITAHSYDFTGNSVPYQVTVLFHFLYATAEGKLQNMDFTREMTGQTPVKAENDDMITLETDPEAVTCRLQNPRKLTVKGKLRHAVTAYHLTEVSPKIEGAKEESDESSIETLQETVKSTVMTSVSEKDTPISEDTEIDSALPSIREIVSVEMDPYMTDIKTANGKLSYKGEITTATLYLADSDSEIPLYITSYGKITLYGDIYDDEIRENQIGKAEISLSTPEFRPQTNAFGENRTVETDFTYSVTVNLFENKESILTKDAYSTKYHTELAENRISFSSVLAGSSFHFSSEGTYTPDDPDFNKVTSVSATTAVTHAEKQGNKLHFDGLMTVCLILTNQKGDYLSRIFDFPTHGECDATGLPENFAVKTACAVPTVLARMQEDHVICHTETFISYLLFENHSDSYVETVTLCPDQKEENRTKSSLTICYPGEKDTLFSIAKRYRTTVSDIRLRNDVGETLPDLLVIPKKDVKNGHRIL